MRTMSLTHTTQWLITIDVWTKPCLSEIFDILMMLEEKSGEHCGDMDVYIILIHPIFVVLFQLEKWWTNALNHLRVMLPNMSTSGTLCLVDVKKNWWTSHVSRGNPQLGVWALFKFDECGKWWKLSLTVKVSSGGTSFLSFFFTAHSVLSDVCLRTISKSLQ